MADEPEKPALSRRDFLRRAGREAAETGVQIVPGARVAAAAVKTPWWKKIAAWRQDRTPSTDSAPNPDETQTEHEQTDS